MKQQYRSGETQHYPFRSERFYHANNAWYFLIRGGASEGPFQDRAQAEVALEQYIATQQRLDQAFHQAQENLQ